MSSDPSADANAVVRAADALTTQVRRVADALSLATDDDATTPTTTRPLLARLLDAITHSGPGYDLTPAGTPATDKEAQHTDRRASIRNLIGRIDRLGALKPSEADLLRQQVEAEMRDVDTARAVAAGNKRHVQLLFAELERANAVTAEAKRLLERRTKKLRTRAEMAETELRTLRAGLRANGADPTQIQNLWAQISLRNRQWREAKREIAVTRNMLQSEGGDVALVDEMVATVSAAEGRAREAQAAIERVRAQAEAQRARGASRSTDHKAGLYDAAVAILAALDGTDQPTTLKGA